MWYIITSLDYFMNSSSMQNFLLVKDNVPYFLLQSIREMSKKLRAGNHQHLGHHCLIKMIVVDALRNLRIPILWSKFIDMDRETFIETQALTPGETPSSSFGGREGKTKEEEKQARRGGEEVVGLEEKERDKKVEKT